MICEITQELLRAPKMKRGDYLISSAKVPNEEKFTFEYYSMGAEPIGLSLLEESIAVGFKEFSGPKIVHPRGECSVAPFYGFEAQNGTVLPYILKNGDSFPSFALYIDQNFRERYSGGGIALLSVSFSIMSSLLGQNSHENKDTPLHLSKDCRTPIYTKHFGGRVIGDYLDEGIDVAVFRDVKLPSSLGITRRE